MQDALDRLRKIASSYGGANSQSYVVDVEWKIARFDPFLREQVKYRVLTMEHVRKVAKELGWPCKIHSIEGDGMSATAVIESNLPRRQTLDAFNVALGNVMGVRHMVDMD